MNNYLQPKTKNPRKLQKWFRSKKWGIDQYWKITYTLYANNLEEKDYISVIKARSFDLAQDLLCNKIKRDSPQFNIKNIKGYMFHKDFNFNRSKSKLENLINIKDWQNIRNCAFPNENAHLFKMVTSIRSEKEILERNEEKLKNLL